MRVKIRTEMTHVMLTPTELKTYQNAAESVNENLSLFIRRAIEQRIKTLLSTKSPSNGEVSSLFLPVDSKEALKK
jgi:hypothetical protein